MSEQPAEMTGSQYAVIMQRGHTPSLDEFKRMEVYDRNTFWRLQCGDHQNLLDQAIDELESANKRLAAVESLADNAELVPIHVGGGNLVNQQLMIRHSKLRAAMESTS